MDGFPVNQDAGNSCGVFSLYIANIWEQQLKVVETHGWESLLNPAGCRWRRWVCRPKRAPTASSAGCELVALVAGLHSVLLTEPLALAL